jgi:hypothetical protein
MTTRASRATASIEMIILRLDGHDHLNPWGHRAWAIVESAMVRDGNYVFISDTNTQSVTGHQGDQPRRLLSSDVNSDPSTNPGPATASFVSLGGVLAQTKCCRESVTGDADRATDPDRWTVDIHDD